MSGSNHLKTPLFQSLGKVVRQRITDFREIEGKALPCVVESVSGSEVTVSFDVDTEFTLPKVTMPVISSPYVSLPIQPGNRGLSIPASMPIAGVLSPRPSSNLGALVFLPLFSGTMGDALVLSSPDGQNTVSISDAEIVITCGSQSITLTPTGIDIVGALTINGVPFLLHTHGGVTTGSGISGGVV